MTCEDTTLKINPIIVSPERKKLKWVPELLPAMRRAGVWHDATAEAAAETAAAAAAAEATEAVVAAATRLADAPAAAVVIAAHAR